MLQSGNTKKIDLYSDYTENKVDYWEVISLNQGEGKNLKIVYPM